LNWARRPATSGNPASFSAAILVESGEVVIKGSIVVLAPSIGSMMPDEAILIWLRSAVIMSSRLRLAAFRLSQAI
jgi:hypothetical protein